MMVKYQPMIRRHLHDVLAGSLDAFPVVLLVGARQVGKSTLARALADERWGGTYVTLDERISLDAALTDPDGFVRALSTPVVIDEVQRAPDLLRAIKVVVDRNREPGRFLLTGSSHVTTLSRVSETLAGRVAVHVLRPLSASELAQRPAPDVVEQLFSITRAPALLRGLPKISDDAMARLHTQILRGGYPTPAMMEQRGPRRTWFDSYRQTYVERDLRDISNIHHLPDFGRLMTIAALRTGQLLNVSSISRDVGLPNATLRRYLALLEQTFQIERLVPYAANVGKRLVRSPKLYVTDSGMAAHLAAVDDWGEVVGRGMAGALLETWAFTELRKLLELAQPNTQLAFWRTHPGSEVDFILERGGEVVGIEVKLAARIDRRDLAGMRACADDLADRWRFGVLLHGGTEAVALDERTLALPIATFFGV